MHIRNVEELITVLGGNTAVQAMFRKRPGNNAVSNWRERGQLPAKSYVVLQRHLRMNGHDAPPALWGMYQPAKRNRKVKNGK